MKALQLIRCQRDIDRFGPIEPRDFMKARQSFGRNHRVEILDHANVIDGDPAGVIRDVPKLRPENMVDLVKAVGGRNMIQRIV